MGLYALVCLLPVLLVFIASISDDASLTQKGFSFFPTAFSTKGWDYVFNFGSQLLRSYEVTIFITVVGTAAEPDRYEHVCLCALEKGIHAPQIFYCAADHHHAL